MSSGVSLFIIILTVLNTVAAVWLLYWMRKGPGEASTTKDTTGHVWDGDLQELNNPLPRWWLWLFILSVIFAVGYVALYGGLGNLKGTLGWSQVKQWEALQAEQERSSQIILARFADLEVAELINDGQAIGIGRNLFANQCAACHGSDGRGSLGFPNLTDDDWLWGGDPEDIVASITQGRMGVMTPWGDVLGESGLDDAAAYVMSLSNRTAPRGKVAAGAEYYASYCAACHGDDARGVAVLGAPNLTDNIWLHGGSFEAIRATIANGRQNNMPAQEQLGETRIKLLAAYVLSLGESSGSGGGGAAP